MAQLTVSRFRRAVAAAKVESTYGTDPGLAAADIIPMRNAVWRSLQEQVRNDQLTGVLAELPDIPGGRTAAFSGETLLRGSGSAYSATVKPEVDALLRAAGLAATGTFTPGSERWEYKPQSGATMGESVTAALFAENAPQGKLTGAHASARITCRRGEPAVLAANLTGLYAEPADAALITATLPFATQPPTFKSGAVTLDGVTTLRVTEIDVDLGNVLQYVPSANDAQSYAGVVIADRRITVILDPEAVPTTTYNFHNKRDTGALVALTWQVGTVQYSRIKFSVPKLQILEIEPFQRDGLRAYRLTCKATANAGGDEITITWD